jgi:glycosyltransferase involved in cell wall biosynthesis
MKAEGLLSRSSTLKHRMRVLQVVNDFFPEPGGVQRFVLELSKALCRRGIEVKVLSTTHPPNGEHGAVDGLPVTYIGHLFRVSQTLISPKLVHRLMSEEADVVHTHLPPPWNADWAAITGALRRRPVILTWHNDITGPGWKRPVTGAYNWSLHQLTLFLTDRIVITTPHRLTLSPILSRFSKKVVHIGEGIDCTRFRPISAPSNGNTVGFLALLRSTHRYKGLHVLLKAMRILNGRRIPIKLKVGGDGNLLPYYRSLAVDLGVQDSVEFTGFIPEDSLVEFYNSLDAFVLPSVDYHIEGFGLVALEAASCGRPVVTTTAAGIAPIISENGCGLVVPPADPEALADAIQGLLGGAAARVEMGQRGRALAERLSWDKVAEDYEQLYAEALLGRKGERT